MSILSRLNQILKANINDLLDKAEDPAKMIDQTLRDLREDLAEVKKETANVMADEKVAERKVSECKEEIVKADTAARNALKTGNEGDARKILVRKAELENSLTSLTEAYDAAHQNSEKLRAAHDKLVGDIESLENRKDGIKAKVAVAKAQERINKMTGVDHAASSIEAFDRWEAKANKRLDSAQAAEELNKGSDTKNLVSKYASGSGIGIAVDEELAKMKKELGIE